ncbi:MULTISPECIES: putative Ig domain-containing protein [unclassified Agrobacterium]|uniref:putative Ig domain-containing protein n=1 Tax=unclassified Agrobacterium TaxID=2632611 RepID=UPI000376305D|nr:MULTISPECIES: putative Ig domain-containing protein [unclassified Agrobacterium]SNB71865.1 Putative Ig domain-containing protein [Agrobacterium sp. 719_389]
MLKAISIAILIVSSASAGEIVWRSPASGTLTAVTVPATPSTEPEQSSAGIYYEPISVSVGTSVVIKPIGDVSGHTFTLKQTLPPGLILDSKTGRIVGVAAVAGNHDITLRAAKDGYYADLVLSLTVS